jgi:hypothetical protein
MPIAHVRCMTYWARRVHGRQSQARLTLSCILLTAACAGSATTAEPGTGGETGLGGASLLATGGNTRLKDPVSGGGAGGSGTDATTGGGVTGGASAGQGGTASVATAAGGATGTRSCPSVPTSGDCEIPGLVCEYRYELQCDPGCYGGDMHRLVCEQGKWIDTHTAGAPICYCPDSGP